MAKVTKKGGGGKGRTISKVKKTNIKRHKLVKAGKLKPKSKPKFLEGGHLKSKKLKGLKNDGLSNEEKAEKERQIAIEKKKREDEMYSQMAEMMDPEDLEYLKKNASRSKAFKVDTAKESKKRLDSESDNGENESEDEDMDDFESSAVKRITDAKMADKSDKKRDLLPVRSKDGWEQRSMEVEDQPSDSENNSENEENSDDDEAMEEDDALEKDKPVSVLDIMAKRRQLIEETKLKIGSMAMNFLENPEERMHTLDRLIKFMTLGENDASVEKTVIKLAAASVLEILKDTIPNYKIADHDSQDKNVKLKKDTLKLHKFETALLGCVKRYLVKCERIVSESKNEEKNNKVSLAPHALRCMTELLVAHPEFNYSENMIQFVVPYLNSPQESLRSIVKAACDKLFKNDKKGQVSLLIVRSINHHLKSKKRERIRPEMLNVLLALKLYHLENPKDIASSHLEAKKKKDRNEMSKKERKAAKAQAKLDKELLEAKAEESAQTRLKFATEITNFLFAIYFRLIKDPTGSASADSGSSVVVTNRTLLRPVLTGLSKFGHLMSVNYFQDLLQVLSGLLERKIVSDKEHLDGKYFLGNHESLLCISTVLAILSGQGEQLTLDPEKFYNHLDRVLGSMTSTDLKSTETYDLASKVLREAFINRRKKVSRTVLLQAMKRVGVASLQGGGASLISFLKDCISAHPPSVQTTLLLKDDEEFSQSTHLPGFKSGIISEPLLWELATETNHVDKDVANVAQNILGVNKNQVKNPNKISKIPPGQQQSANNYSDNFGFVILQ